jgi:hypothetical protein
VNLVRCPNCRTLNDVGRQARCDGCNRDLTGITPGIARVEAVVRQAARDQTTGRGFLLGLGILSAVSLLGVFFTKHSSQDAGCLMSILGISSVTTFVWFALARRIHSSRAPSMIRLLGYVFSFGVAIFGATILIGLACAMGGFKVA